MNSRSARTIVMLSAVLLTVAATSLVHAVGFSVPIQVFPSGSEDVYIRNTEAPWSFAGSDNIQAQTVGGQINRSMIYVDLSPYAGFVVVGDGTFHMWSEQFSLGAATEVNVVHIEDTGDQWWGPDAGDQNPSWNNNEGDFGATLSTFETIGGAARDTEHTFTIPEAVLQGWIDDPETNFGFGLMLADESVPPERRGGAFRSGDTLAANKPYLEFVPEPGSALVLVLAIAGVLGRRVQPCIRSGRA